MAGSTYHRHLFLLCLYLIALAGKLSAQIAPGPDTSGITTVWDFEVFEDKTNSYQIDQVINSGGLFRKSNGNSLPVANATFWLKIRLKNYLKPWPLFLQVENPSLQRVFFYSAVQGRVIDSIHMGREYQTKYTVDEFVNFTYKIPFPATDATVVYIKIKSVSQMQIPILIGSKDRFYEKENLASLFFGIYAGIFAIMVLYHVVISFSVKDKSYVYYVFFIFFVGLTQVVLKGYGAVYLWPDNRFILMNSTALSGFLSGVATLVFTQNFLHTRLNTPRGHKIINGIIVCFVIAMGIYFLGNEYLAFNIINFLALSGSIIVLIIGMAAYKNKVPTSFYFLLAFSIFLGAVVIYVLRSNGFVAYNLLTANILEIGSSIEIVLLSLALADKINIYRKNQEIARKEALRVSTENERLIKEQNIILEKEVRSRTEELQYANEELQEAMNQIKNTQAKLVETEKMASLGQLTAGIAHEINNPINFVTSNIRPLEADVADLTEVIKMYEGLDLSKDIKPQIDQIEQFKKDIDLNYLNEEITTLLSGIKEGASRTSEIVRGLRSFARVDEANWKHVNINDGLESTILLVKNSFPKNFELIKQLGDIPKIECAAGSINQVFMNIITNAVQAIKEEQQKSNKTGRLEVTTAVEDAFVVIKIRDNGPGMPEEVKSKIFDPFFTTKDVGEGTGLGLSIVQGIIEKHNGFIEVVTGLGEGTTFIIGLPVR
ncbi:hypothetical protein A8C56_03450 [Niabella ginsenosidivorans]|uniref:histidine kinase n=1 Tax=Niabella ginsenosidivorans TaxID=1176587 RepID=A0A1A9HYJ4_9BACT|nr:7TM diverse intracellular signaling domain-containing protein [Niabella ginsenosidivorans]ANH80165.1 hypothetical protein A8C56_03450 [Niabella ginsenosidivorans]